MHWYFSNFLPALFCGVGLFLLLKGLYIGAKDNSKLLVFSVLFSLFSYSILGHKEHRFIMPLIPLMLAFMTLSLPRQITNYLNLFCIVNVLLASYLSIWHQSGPQSVMKYLSSKTNGKGILILTPCHGTPFYRWVWILTISNYVHKGCPKKNRTPIFIFDESCLLGIFFGLFRLALPILNPKNVYLLLILKIFYYC